MSEASTQTQYLAVKHDQGGERVVGTVALDADATMHVQPSDPEEGPKLERAAREMNQSTVLHTASVPPEGAPRFSVASRIVKRGDPDFVTLMMDELRKYYAIELRPQ